MTRLELLRVRKRRLDRKEGKPGGTHVEQKERLVIRKALLSGRDIDEVAREHALPPKRVWRIASPAIEAKLNAAERRNVYRRSPIAQRERQRACQWCSAAFECYPSSPTRYCSRTCSGLAWSALHRKRDEPAPPRAETPEIGEAVAAAHDLDVVGAGGARR